VAVSVLHHGPVGERGGEFGVPVPELDDAELAVG
jgi:hypothetical protein